MKTLDLSQIKVYDTMFKDFTKYIDFLLDNKMTADQFLFCYLLYIDRNFTIHQREGERGLTLLYRYATNCGVYDHTKSSYVAWNQRELDELENRGFVTNTNSPGKYLPDYYDVTPLFVACLNIHAHKHNELITDIDNLSNKFEQFWKAYPSFIDNFNDPNAPKIPLKAIVKEEIEKIYNNKINSKIKHKKMIAVVNWAKKNRRINTNIKNFLTGEIYKPLYKEMKNNEGNTLDRIIGL